VSETWLIIGRGKAAPARSFFYLRAGAGYYVSCLTGKTDGNGPSSGLIRDSAGNFYGTTGGGGALADCYGYG
jgi:hypothetical protein